MELRLKRLHLENFKCHKALTIDFGGRSTSIYGDNATGKTSIYDGLTWLLFGKDSLGNGEKSLEIKPLRPDGSVEDHEAVTEVEAVFLADGEEVRDRKRSGSSGASGSYGPPAGEAPSRSTRGTPRNTSWTGCPAGRTSTRPRWGSWWTRSNSGC